MIDQIYILGLPWKIEFSDSMADFGECQVNERLIRILTKQNPEQLRETILHEISHAIWEMTDIQDQDREETTVKRLSTGLCSVLCDKRNQAFLDLF